MNDIEFLKEAINQARESVKQGGFPAGAVVVKDGQIVAKGISIGGIINDPTSHAETSAIRDACKTLKTTNLDGATLYESLACCLMCFSVANWAGITRIVTAARKTPDMVSKGYYEGSTDTEKINEENNRRIQIDYIPELEAESLALVKEWEAKLISS